MTIARRAITFSAALSMGLAPVGGRPAAAQAVQDPPARVGRLASLAGTVSYHLAGADRWDVAVANLPVTAGFALWTEPAARASIEVGPNRITLDASTEFEATQFDDRVLSATQAQGAAYLHLTLVQPGESYVVQTPRGIVALATVGRYEVVSGDTEHPTQVTVLEGAAEITGGAAPVQLGPNQTATITGDGQGAPFQATVGPAVRGPFLAAMLAAERPAPPRRTVPVPAAVARMTGGEDLDQYGEWAASQDYGAVWYPRADPGYVPYRNGHWSFVQPWGWTWVDDAAWGFAPSHYGRWVEVDNRWGWVPGVERQGPGGWPVYAPAVVSFLGAGALGAAAVGWVPLGPREPYYPPYRVSTNYLRQVNIRNVTNVDQVVNVYRRAGVRPEGPLLNRGAATMVPQDAMTGSRAVGPVGRPVPANLLQQRPPRSVFPPVAPTSATAGVTPAVARAYNLAPQPGPGRPAAPGPSLDPNAFRRGARPGVAPAGLAGPGGPVPGIGPGAGGPGAPGPGETRPGDTRPGERGPGERGPGEPGRPGLGVAGGAAAGAVAGAAAGALLRPRGPEPGVGPAGLPQLRQNGLGGPAGPRQGAPGPAINRPGFPAAAPGNPAVPPGAVPLAPAPGAPGLRPGGPGAEPAPQLRAPGAIPERAGPAREPGQPPGRFGAPGGPPNPGGFPGRAPQAEPRAPQAVPPPFAPRAAPEARPAPQVPHMAPMAQPHVQPPPRIERPAMPPPQMMRPQAPPPQMTRPPQMERPAPPRMERPQAPPPQQRAAPPPPQARPQPPPPQQHQGRDPRRPERG